MILLGELRPSSLSRRIENRLLSAVFTNMRQLGTNVQIRKALPGDGLYLLVSQDGAGFFCETCVDDRPR